MNSNYKQKYIKYKQKYLELIKSLKGGNNYSNEMITFIREKANEINSIFNSETDLNKFDLNQLKIDLSLEEITEIYNNKYLQLRKYNNERYLMIACGNYRLDNCNLEPNKDCETSINNNKYHSHRDFFTIDTTLVANPSIVSIFGNNNIIYNTLPNHSFILIIFEGGGDVNPIEIERLLDNKTNSFCIIQNDGRFIIYSYYQEGKYIIQENN